MKKVIIIPEVKNLEDELVRSCNIANVKELMKSKSNSEYKSDLAKCKNLKLVLINHHFDINSFWNQNPKGAFDNVNIKFTKMDRLIFTNLDRII